MGGDSVGDSLQPGFLSPSDTPPTSKSAKLLLDVPLLARGIVPHEEVFALPDGKPAAKEEPPPIACAASASWHEPKALLDRLEVLASERSTRQWATETAHLVRRLGPSVSSGSDQATSILQRLEEKVNQVGPLADASRAAAVASKLRRAGHALRRRLGLWQQVALASRQSRVRVWRTAQASTRLSPYLAKPVDSATGETPVPLKLLEHLERYEQSGLASDARQLAKDHLYMTHSSSDGQRRLADRLGAYYRNANLRVAVTEELLNRLIPDREPQQAWVHDSVLGVPVRGRSLTSTDMGLRLLPDPNRVRMALEITGEIDAQTYSSKGPATFYNNSESVYIAHKPLELDLAGIHVSPADVAVCNQTRLRQVQTSFDGIPLVGPLFKGVARSRHDKKRPALSREIKRKIARKARKRIDGEADARLGELSQRLRRQVFQPLGALSLDPTMISSETTERRFTMRLRLADEDQLGGHTPRPRAPSDSLASFQLHETAMNNALERLELDGRTFTLPQLSHHIAARLGQPQSWETDPANDDVTITFAKQDAVGVRCRDGRVVLTLSVARLRKPPRRWNNFQVRVFYRPQVRGRSAELVRDGVIHLVGKRLRTGSRIALHGIFAKTFPRRRPVNLTPERLLDDPKLADLAITQFVVDDGWVGAALGPRRTALRSALRRR